MPTLRGGSCLLAAFFQHETHQKTHEDVGILPTICHVKFRTPLTCTSTCVLSSFSIPKSSVSARSQKVRVCCLQGYVPLYLWIAADVSMGSQQMSLRLKNASEVATACCTARRTPYSILHGHWRTAGQFRFVSNMRTIGRGSDFDTFTSQINAGF